MQNILTPTALSAENNAEKF